MEDWHKKHIEKNLPALIDLTTCSEGLKARLRSKELLTREEDERLTALGRNYRLISEAKLLYELMKTRSRGYSGLMEVLRDARQDGALNILLEGFQQPQSQVAFADSMTQLLSLRVQLATCTKSFNEIFPDFTCEDAKDLLQNGDLKLELEEIFQQGSLEIKLDGELPVTSDLYIPRLLSNRLRLDPRVFSLKSCEDVFVFTNIDIKELTQLVKPCAVRFSSNQRSLVTGRHIYLDEDGDWDDMVGISEAAIHLVRKEDGGYILQRTTKVTDVLQNNVLRAGRKKEAFITEDAVVDEFLSDNDSKGALICDVAGMGKTWLMRRLASKIRDKNQKVVTFFVKLSSLSKAFSWLKQTAAPHNQALNTVLMYVCKSKLASQSLHKYAAQYGLKILFVLDGFDEISNDDVEVVKSSLEVCSKLDHIRFIISSRPNTREILQQTFNLVAYDIHPFYKEEQIRCMIEQWAHVCPQSDSGLCKLKEFALKCAKSVKLIQNDEIHDILGVPLKCRMLATVNEKQANQLCKANRRRPLQIVEAAPIKCLSDLYTVFFDTLVEKLADTMPLDARHCFRNKIFIFYTHMALELLFPDISNVHRKHHNIDTSMDESFSRVGVACLNHGKQRLEFIHRSFAEYFVGRLFADFWNDIEQYSPCIVHMAAFYFIRNIMIPVDGEFKIHPDPSEQSNEWEWNLKYKTLYYINFLSFMNDKEKVFHLKYPLILLFMNMNLKVNRSRNVSMSFETEAMTTTQSLHPMERNTNYSNELCGLKKWLAKSSFATMVACMEERLTNIFSLYVQILISLFDTEDRVALLLPNENDQEREITERAAILLCKAAMSKSPENAVELFNLFGDSEENFLSLLCQRYQREYWSPLEVAIITEDLDMVLYFGDKVSLPFDRLFFTCVADLAEPELDAKLKILKMVLGSSDRVLNFLRMDSLCSNRETAVWITKYSFQLLLKFLEDSECSISSIIGENKRWILENCLPMCNDEEMVNLLLSLYAKNDDKKLPIVNLAAGRTFTAEIVLDALDLVEVTDAFSEVEFNHRTFENCSNLETLKVLTAIQPDFSRCNKDKWNYLHAAAYTRNIDWVKHSIDSGYEVEQLDKSGRTPLLCASLKITHYPKSMLVVTQLLVGHGANVYAKDNDGRNVAHCVFKNCRNADSKDLCEWVFYLLENGCKQLWEMRDRWGKTPQETLIIFRGKNSQVTTGVIRLLENYSVVSTK